MTVKEMKKPLALVFKQKENDRRWREIDNRVKRLYGYKPEAIEEDEYSFIADIIINNIDLFKKQ
ncbi:hypothetical protein RyT2_26490 [Pseudolactococcus yaeyamensis]